MKSPDVAGRLCGQRFVFIARHFPPLISGGGRRSLALAEALKSQGAEVVVVSPKAGSEYETLVVPHPQSEPSRETEPAVGRLSSLKRILNWVRANLLLPDPDIRWANRARVAILASEREFDWVLTSSPSESCHAVAAKLTTQRDIKWIADFRDHWFEASLLDVRHKKIRRWVETCLAARWLRRANVLIAVSGPIAAEIERLSDKSVIELPQITFAIPDDDDAEGFVLPDDLIHVAHTGAFSLSDPDRNIQAFLSVIEAALSANPALRFHLIGNLTHGELAALSTSPASHAIKYYGILKYETTLAFQARMHGLIVCSSPLSPVIPGKFFEYKRTGLPIVAIGGKALMVANEQSTAPEDLLAQLTSEAVVLPGEVQGYGVIPAGEDLAALILRANQMTTDLR